MSSTATVVPASPAQVIKVVQQGAVRVVRVYDGPMGPTGPPGAVGPMPDAALGIARHLDGVWEPRPALPVVLWIGPEAPPDAVEQDLWIVTG